MYSSEPAQPSRPFLTQQPILEWAEQHYRCRTFRKEQRIPTRPGLVYLVISGAVRLVGIAPDSPSLHPVSSPKTTGDNLPHTGLPPVDLTPFSPSPRLSRTSREFATPALKLNPLPVSGEDKGENAETFLGFVSQGQPFEVASQRFFTVEAYAHIDQTSVMWMYWPDLDQWPLFRQQVLDGFRYQHQRKLLWLGILGQRRTIARLLGFLTLLIEEHGQAIGDDPEGEGVSGYYLPWNLTHAQIGSAIGSTRVTVTRLMGKLRAEGLIRVGEGHLIGLPPRQ
ncbi:Crp/Fnr family transcriptional regulator [Oscillatoria acuminata]|uniref:Bacterial regulatory protein, crp family n=1 Tax=Oscillatoria acuminata PCC 6304 TaxID=56110 RepID=K9TMG0_9CYAN|nr:Crp/Fnr family transcriptional regulator [Oscillatoria acuminata]AFY83730.1 Bacterial regulatory protein, crp family [Oscillatoria acuminata PCC 6304]